VLGVYRTRTLSPGFNSSAFDGFSLTFKELKSGFEFANQHGKNSLFINSGPPYIIDIEQNYFR
jgi:hypothetical protein